MLNGARFLGAQRQKAANRRIAGLGLTSALLVTLACRPSQPSTPPPTPPPAKVESDTKGVVAAPEETFPELRSGEVPAQIEHRPILAAFDGFATWEDQTFIHLKIDPTTWPDPLQWSSSVHWRIEAIDDEAHDITAFASQDEDRSWSIWLRYTGKPGIRLPDLSIVRAGDDHDATWRGHVAIGEGMPRKADPSLAASWLQALAQFFESARMANREDPFSAFASQRLQSIAQSVAPRRTRNPSRISADDRLNRSSELSFVMETMTGSLALQETLQAHRGLWLEGKAEPAKIDIRTLNGPRLVEHPFAAMLAQLPNSGKDEALARLVPNDFYYLRFSNLSTLFHALDVGKEWGKSLVAVAQHRLEALHLALRYETQLGLTRGPLARALGDSVVGEVAWAGSDPYLREGSDVTVIFAVKNRPLFEAGLLAALTPLVAQHGPLSTSTLTHGNATITLRQSGNDLVHQYRASVGEFEMVSNSLGAMKKALDCATNPENALASSPDFRYMLARDAKKADAIFGFISDRFVANVVGPEQKIQQARRQVALAELATPGYAALLYGWLHGKLPADTKAMLASKVLNKSDLQHSRSREPIVWEPSAPAHSSWGQVAALRPLIDAPPLTRVTSSEAAAYATFANEYEAKFSRFIDPIAWRANFVPDAQGEHLDLDLRMLPVLETSDYRELQQWVGQVKIAADPSQGLARLVIGIGEDARLRRFVRESGQELTHQSTFSLDWLGSFALLAGLDKPAWANLALLTVDGLEPHSLLSEDERAAGRGAGASDDVLLDQLKRLPLFFALEVKDLTGATLTLAALKQLASDVAPGAVTWRADEKIGEAHLVRIGINEREGARDSFALYYTLFKDAWIVGLSREAIAAALNDHENGQWPHTASTEKSGTGDAAQVIVEGHAEAKSGFRTALHWLLTREFRRQAHRQALTASMALRGSGQRSLSEQALDDFLVHYFGRGISAPEGGNYLWQDRELVDPVRGPLSAPRWPALPVAGSPVDRLLRVVQAFRLELAFDNEGQFGEAGEVRSMHIKARLSATLGSTEGDEK